MTTRSSSSSSSGSGSGDSDGIDMRASTHLFRFQKRRKLAVLLAGALTVSACLAFLAGESEKKRKRSLTRAHVREEEKTFPNSQIHSRSPTFFFFLLDLS